MRILIVEDEALIARRLARLCREILGADLAYLKSLHRLDEAQTFLSREPVDVVLLDLNLHGEDGFELLKTMVAASFHTIIVSAQKDQALRAFEYGVLDFIGKPFDKARLAKSFQRLRHTSPQGGQQTRFLAIRKPTRVDLVAIEDILFIRGAGPYSELLLRSSAEALHHKSLDRLSAILPNCFMRVHKSYVVNLHDAQHLQVHPGSRYELHLTNGQVIPVGRTRVKALRERLG